MIVGVILLILAVALIVVGALAALGKLPGNKVIGLRVPEVRKSQDLWTLGHRIAGPFWGVGGVSFLFAGLMSFTVYGWTWAIPVVLVVIGLGLIGAGSARAAHAVAAVDARRIIAESTGDKPKPKVDLNAARRAAKEAGKRAGQ